MRTRWIAALAFAACGTETGNGASGVDTVVLALEGDVSGGKITGKDADGNSFEISRAIAHLRHVELQAPGAGFCDPAMKVASGVTVHCDESKLRLDGPFTADLLAGTSTPSLAGIAMPSVELQRVDVRLEPPKTGPRVSLAVGGTIAAQRFAFDFDMNEDARYEGAALQLSAELDEEIDLLLDVRKWLSDVALKACIQSGDLPVEAGVARLDRVAKGPCKDVDKTVREAVKKSGRLSKKQK